MLEKIMKTIFIILSIFIMPKLNAAILNEEYLNNNSIEIEINEAYIKYENLTDEEKEKVGLVPNKYNIYKKETQKNEFYNSSTPFSFKFASLPTKYDLTNVSGNRLVPQVDNQGNLGLCWIFSSNNMLESYLLRSTSVEYNYSENQIDYAAGYLNLIPPGSYEYVLGQGNSFFNLSQVWYYGYGPITETIYGPYFQTNETKELAKTVGYEYLEKEVTSYNSLYPLDILSDTYATKTADEMIAIINQYNTKVKQHIMSKSAVTSGIYMSKYNQSTNMVYNNTKISDSDTTGHAITLIGWDDSKGTVNFRGKSVTGAWLAMNSWGDNTQYFYISYYDVDLLKSFNLLNEVSNKNWDNFYSDFSGFEILEYDEDLKFEYEKGNQIEKLKSAKIYYFNIFDGMEIEVEVGDTKNSTSKTFTVPEGLGFITVPLDNINLTDSKIYAEITSPNDILIYDVGIRTQNNSTTKSIELVEYETNDYENLTTGKRLDYYVRTKNLPTVKEYSVTIKNEQGTNISSFFEITKNSLINGSSDLKIKALRQITASELNIVINVDGTSKTITYIIDDTVHLFGQLSVTFNNYLTTDNLVYNILPKTTVESFINNTIISDGPLATVTIYKPDGSKLNSNNYVGTDNYVIITDGTTNIQYTISVKGDINKDGKIGIGDLNYVADYISASTEEKNTIITKESQLKSADITGDGKIRIGDLNAIADSI